MPNQNDSQEKTEEATPYKLEKAREKGTVFKSPEVSSFFSLFTLGILIVWMGYGLLYQLMHIFQGWFVSLTNIQTTQHFFSLFSILFDALSDLILPLLITFFLVFIGANLLQVGFVFSTFPLKPDLNKINPIKGLKKLFSLKILVEAFKTFCKIIFITLIGYYAISAVFFKSLHQGRLNKKNIIDFVLYPSGTLILKVSMLILIIALLDYLYNRKDFFKKMRMSKKELTDEIKHREGDPRIKSKRKQLSQELLKKTQSLARVKEADLLITNPTHYSIAIAYRREAMAAPQVVAKGTNKLAKQIRFEARRHNIPIVESPALARGLYYHAEIDQPIPFEYYPKLARILKWIYGLTSQ